MYRVLICPQTLVQRSVYDENEGWFRRLLCLTRKGTGHRVQAGKKSCYMSLFRHVLTLTSGIPYARWRCEQAHRSGKDIEVADLLPLLLGHQFQGRRCRTMRGREVSLRPRIERLSWTHRILIVMPLQIGYRSHAVGSLPGWHPL